MYRLSIYLYRTVNRRVPAEALNHASENLSDACAASVRLAHYIDRMPEEKAALFLLSALPRLGREHFGCVIYFFKASKVQNSDNKDQLLLILPDVFKVGDTTSVAR